jgi:hypothetical protein
MSTARPPRGAAGPRRDAPGADAHAALAAALCAALTTLLPLFAAAQPHPIVEGNEERVLALFSPYALAAPITPEYRLWNVRIEPSRIEVELRRADALPGEPGDAPSGAPRGAAAAPGTTTLSLVHPDEARADAERSASFALVASGADDEAARRARQRLAEAIRRNDAGGFWREATRPALSTWSVPRLLGAAEWGPIDGVIFAALIFALGGLLAARNLRGQPGWMTGALLAAIVAGALVRLAVSPRVFLGAWPWSRLYAHARAVAESPWLDVIAGLAGAPVTLIDVMLWTTFAYAVAMPLVLFSHATYLLRDARAGLIAAALVALLPQHVRFSIAEDGFVGSLTLTSLGFALFHGFLRDPSRAVRLACVLTLPFILFPGYLLRPLNILFVPVYALAALALHPDEAPRSRRVVALAVVLGVGAAAASIFLRRHQETIGAVTSPVEWLIHVLIVLVDPRLLVLTDIRVTPLPLVALAVAGGVWAYREGERRLVLFLLGWLLLFLVAHAVVVQETMQPRYHMHLVVPFLLLAALGAVRAWARLRDAAAHARRRRALLAAAAAWVVLAPALHLGFIRHLDYAEQQEFLFVRAAAPRVPAQCVVVEYTGGPPDVDELRFSRAAALAGAARGRRFRVVGVTPDGGGTRGHPTLDEVLAERPPCLMLYEGLACSAFRAPGETYASACLRLRQRLAATEVVAETRTPARLYDSASGGPEGLATPEVPLRLARATPWRTR